MNLSTQKIVLDQKKKEKENTNRTFLLIERFFRDTPKDNGVMMFFSDGNNRIALFLFNLAAFIPFAS